MIQTKTMNSEEYEYWCDLAARFKRALENGSAATLTVDAQDMMFLSRWVEEAC